MSETFSNGVVPGDRGNVFHEHRQGDFHEVFGRAVLDYVQAASLRKGSPVLLEPGAAGSLVEAAHASIWRLVPSCDVPSDWIYFRLGISPEQNWKTLVMLVGTCLRARAADFHIAGWWWLNKHDPCGPALRVRIQMPPACKEDFAEWFATRLSALGCAARTLVYEPELRLFGGPVGMKLAHCQFCIDSDFLSHWLLNDPATSAHVIPEGISVALVLRLLSASGLDPFECWDVFDRLHDKRAFVKLEEEGILRFETVLKKVLGSGLNRLTKLYGAPQSELLTRHIAALDQLGKEISRSYFNGELDCGIRQFLVPVILFHWNRAGYSGATQCGLAVAASRVFQHLARKGTSDDPLSGKDGHAATT